ncbi:MAG: glycosyltransferase family 2 protein [Pseudomonadota bacterium]
MQTAAAITMVRDDLFFLRAWLRHYGALFGRENCYIVNHGRGSDVAAVAQGCNIIGIPGDPHKNFDVKRWGLLNALVGGLRRYYNHVIVGDVDELVVLDPAKGLTLAEWLQDAPMGRVYTPVGLEVVHRVDVEDAAIEDAILGPRRHVRLAPYYSKPCVISAGTKIARGGHYTQYDKLHTPEGLYLMHLKWCDFAAYAAAMDQRNAVTSEIGAGVKDTAIGRHWFAEARGEDRAEFEAFADLEIEEGFDLGWVRKRMHRSFGPRGDTGYFEFRRPDFNKQYVLPDRFFGVI